MINIRHLLWLGLGLLLLSNCKSEPKATTQTLVSPSGNITIHFFLDDQGAPHYQVLHQDKTVIDTSAMSFDFKGQPPLAEDLQIISTDTNTINEAWDMPWGEQATVTSHYNELIVRLAEKSGKNRPWEIHFRAFDDGVGWRYLFPEQQGVDSLTITDENTQFQLTGDHTCWWIPGDWDSYEHLYSTTPFSQIDAINKYKNSALAKVSIPNNAVHTPITMRTADGLHLSFHEANLTNYAGMTLQVDPANLSMHSKLVNSERLGYQVKRALPFSTPWRTIQISEKAADLIASKMTLNLNEPNRLGEVTWFQPQKYMGIWWEMHLDVSKWSKESGKHGATTENAKGYIDFAAANGIKGLLVEGWNTGWKYWGGGYEDREGVFDFVTPYPDYDLKEVVRYGREKGVELIMHHETYGAPRTYDQQLDTAFALMQCLGIHAVKTGYVGEIIPKGEHHHGQWMVNHYRKVLETAAKYQIAINAHEPIKDTGIRRTLPNAIAREGLRGQEFNAWANDGGNPPEHLSIVAFTRMLAGPIDFTPGVFELTLKVKENNQVNTTLAHQLALYVVIYSPIQMACDLPEHYEGHPAFQFIRDVGVDWEQTQVLNGEVGDFVTIARQERGTGNWYLGSITDENKRKINVKFDFLEPGKTYKAVVYRDGDNAHWQKSPGSYVIEPMTVTAETEQTFQLAAGGGLAISLKVKE